MVINIIFPLIMDYRILIMKSKELKYEAPYNELQEYIFSFTYYGILHA